jgi:mevalonate kinase
MINAWSLLYDEIYGDDEMSPCSTDHITVGLSTASDTTFNIDVPPLENITIDTSAFDTVDYDLSGIDFTVAPYEEPVCISTNLDDLVFADTPTPSIKDPSIRKYKEDESIKALQDYISTTYGGHYTSDNNNVQTLDLIESVGDAESFCRSNAIKYLSRYDKKGQAKRDILKALHYSLLLYHFSGQLNETTTRGYETF